MRLVSLRLNGLFQVKCLREVLMSFQVFKKPSAPSSGAFHISWYNLVRMVHDWILDL